MDPFFEQGSGRPRALWRLLVQYCAYKVLVPLLVNLLALSWLLASSGRKVGASGEIDTSSLSPALPLLGGIAALIGVLLSVWLAGRFLDRRPFADFGFHVSGGWWFDLCFGMALGALLMSAIFLVELGFGWITVTGAFRSLVPGTPFALAMLLPTALFVCVGIYEELLFRGYQLRNAAEGLNLVVVVGPREAVILAWVLSSAFFGYLHANNPNATLLSTFNIALAGLMLGFGYVLTGELAIPIGLHITWNLFQGGVFGLPVSGNAPFGASVLSTDGGGPELWTGGPFGPEAGLLGPAAMILGCLLIALWVRLRNGKVAINTPIAEGPQPVQTVAASSGPKG